MGYDLGPPPSRRRSARSATKDRGGGGGSLNTASTAPEERERAKRDMIRKVTTTGAKAYPDTLNQLGL